MRAALLRALIAAAVILGMAAGSPAAWAHTALTATDPAADTTLTSAPARVTATFNEELQPSFAAMTVVGPDGNLWSSGDAEVRGMTLSVAMRPPGPAGTYTVNYRVTSADGHPVSGSWSFTMSAPGPGQPGPAVPAAERDGRIPPWALAVVVAVLIVPAVVWALRRGRA